MYITIMHICMNVELYASHPYYISLIYIHIQYMQYIGSKISVLMYIGDTGIPRINFNCEDILKYYYRS